MLRARDRRSAAIASICVAVLFPRSCFAQSGVAIAEYNAQIASPGASFFRQNVSDAWFTGSLLSSNPSGPPPGHAVIEPYLYTQISSKNFDERGRLKRTPRSMDLRIDLPVMYGVTDGFWLGLITRFGQNSSKGALDGSGLLLGDTTFRLQYRLLTHSNQRSRPTISFGFDLTAPTGQYQNLKLQSRDAISNGVWTGSFALRADYVFWLPNGRILRPRVNISTSLSRQADIHGASVFGTSSDFAGTVRPGRGANVGVSMEYSVSSKIALCGDVIWNHQAATRYTDFSGRWRERGSSTMAVAPAMQYNWNDRMGLIAGVQIPISGQNTSAPISPMIAINMLI